MSDRTGESGLASQTRTRTCALSDSSHRRTGAVCPVVRDACIALVISSDTTSSVLSVSAASPHSHSSCRACRRAHGTAPGSAPNSRKLWSGHWLVMPHLRCVVLAPVSPDRLGAGAGAQGRHSPGAGLVLGFVRRVGPAVARCWAGPVLPFIAAAPQRSAAVRLWFSGRSPGRPAGAGEGQD